MVVGPKGNPAKQLRFKNSVFSESQTWSLGRQKITAKLLEFDFFPRPQASKELGFKKIFHLAPTEDKVRNSALFSTSKLQEIKIIYIDLINVRLPKRMHGQTVSIERTRIVIRGVETSLHLERPILSACISYHATYSHSQLLFVCQKTPLLN